MMIASGQVVVGRVSTVANAGGITPDFTFTTTTTGFNDNDRLELIFISSGTIIDDWHEDNVAGGTGYTYTRNTNITGPNSTYNATEWTGSGIESTTDLGTFSLPLSALPSISTQPLDLTSCSINLSVIATAGNGGALTYQWFFNENNGSTTLWTPVYHDWKLV